MHGCGELAYRHDAGEALSVLDGELPGGHHVHLVVLHRVAVAEAESVAAVVTLADPAKCHAQSSTRRAAEKSTLRISVDFSMERDFDWFVCPPFPPMHRNWPHVFFENIVPKYYFGYVQKA